jgi:hypothetical protein|tara:strand:+ start:1193 stop:1330 length:138 start_codon:yes stop_codon:yes gene_type:complete
MTDSKVIKEYIFKAKLYSEDRLMIGNYIYEDRQILNGCKRERLPV